MPGICRPRCADARARTDGGHGAALADGAGGSRDDARPRMPPAVRVDVHRHARATVRQLRSRHHRRPQGVQPTRQRPFRHVQGPVSRLPRTLHDHAGMRERLSRPADGPGREVRASVHEASAQVLGEWPVPRRSPEGPPSVPQALPDLRDRDGTGHRGPAGSDVVGVERSGRPGVHVSARLHRGDRGRVLRRLQRSVRRGRGRARDLPEGLPRRSVHGTRKPVHAGWQLRARLREVLYDLRQLRDGRQLHAHHVDDHRNEGQHDEHHDEHHDTSFPPCTVVGSTCGSCGSGICLLLCAQPCTSACVTAAPTTIVCATDAECPTGQACASSASGCPFTCGVVNQSDCVLPCP